MLQGWLLPGEGLRVPPETRPATVLHYPVTTRFWRGVYRLNDARGLGRHLRRACDWATISARQADFRAPTCPDCLAYQAALRRLGYLRWD